MYNLIKTELIKIAAKPRSYIGFVAILVICVLLEVAFYVDGSSYISFITQAVEQSFDIQGNILNGYLMCFIILQTLIIQMPLLVALISGDMLSGEAANGTLRLLLTKPFPRYKILLAKWLASNIYTFFLLIFLGVLALGGGLWLFSVGDMVVLKTDMLQVLPSDDVLWRFFAALTVAYVSLVAVGTLALLLSAFSDNSIAPIVTTMAIIILFTIIGSLEVPLFDAIRPFLFTTHMISWRAFFDDPLPLSAIYVSVGILLAHIAVFLGISMWWFEKKDILS